ncbi:APC family permease [Streptomyces sp. NPDC057702]|uniref:APC family permease n=1 Tax=unclassified Streptomyces TaxID=2593676 RepID=UPI0036C35AF8
MDSQTVAASVERTAPREPHTATTLKPNALGVLSILFFVLSAQAPLTGVAGAAPLSVAIGNGSGTPAAYVLAGAVILLFSVGFVAMGRHVVDAGAFSVYIGAGLGRTVAGGSAAVALFAYCVLQAAMYGLYGSIVGAFVTQHTALDLPWWAYTLATMALVRVLGAAGIETGARVLAVLVIAEFGVLLVFGLVTLFKGGGPEGLGVADSFSVSAALQGAPGVSVMFALASMLGFEATAIYGEEAREPAKTVPRATYLAVVVVTVFFALVSWMLVSSYGASQASDAAGEALAAGDSDGFVFVPIAAQFGGWVSDVLPVLLATSLFAGILTFHNSANRYLYSLGRDGQLPRSLARLNGRRAPSIAGRAQTLIALALLTPFVVAATDPVLTLFSWFSGLAVLAMMLLYLLTSVSVVVFFRRRRVDHRRWNTLIAPVLGALGIAGAVWLILANFTTLIGGEVGTAVWLGLTVPLVMALGAANARLRHRRPTPPAG